MPAAIIAITSRRWTVSWSVAQQGGAFFAHLESSVAHGSSLPCPHPQARTAEDVRFALIEHMCAPVRWTHCVDTAEDLQVQAYYEVGPAPVLTPLVRQCAPHAEAYLLTEWEHVAQLAKARAVSS
jgi:hypothetical protein